MVLSIEFCIEMSFASTTIVTSSILVSLESCLIDSKCCLDVCFDGLSGVVGGRDRQSQTHHKKLVPKGG
jgi:hypothetical protein